MFYLMTHLTPLCGVRKELHGTRNNSVGPSGGIDPAPCLLEEYYSCLPSASTTKSKKKNTLYIKKCEKQDEKSVK